MYDELAELYHVVYGDWEASSRRHGAFLEEFLQRPGARVLDVAAGIGTQALPLAALGHEVVARDLSAGAVRRLRREAEERGLEIDAGVGDVRSVGSSVTGPFDMIVCLDNALPHLLTDADIVRALEGFRELLATDGVAVVSVRDYDVVERGTDTVHPYGERSWGGRRFRVAQEWEWTDPERYRVTMVVEEAEGDGWIELVRASSTYYAIRLPRLLELFVRSGLEAEVLPAAAFFQPVIRARRG